MYDSVCMQLSGIAGSLYRSKLGKRRPPAASAVSCSSGACRQLADALGCAQGAAGKGKGKGANSAAKDEL